MQRDYRKFVAQKTLAKDGNGPIVELRLDIPFDSRHDAPMRTLFLYLRWAAPRESLFEYYLVAMN